MQLVCQDVRVTQVIDNVPAFFELEKVDLSWFVGPAEAAGVCVAHASSALLEATK